jgi:signal transduction histidine kinase
VLGDFEELPDAVTANLYRIAQEGLTNAVRHAQARNVEMRLERMKLGASRVREQRVVLTIEDDGRGCSVDDISSKGSGLFGIRERVEGLGGSMFFGRDGGTRTRLQITLPLQIEEAA